MPQQVVTVSTNPGLGSLSNQWGGEDIGIIFCSFTQPDLPPSESGAADLLQSSARTAPQGVQGVQLHPQPRAKTK